MTRNSVNRRAINRGSDFPRGFMGLGIGFGVIWVIAAVLSLATSAVVIWAIVKVVLHFT